MDLHRHAGDFAGHLRDVCRVRPAALRRLAQRKTRGDGGPRRHGRRAAPRGHDERRGLPGRRRGRKPHPAARRNGLLRRARTRPRPGARRGARGERSRRGAVGGAGGQHRRRAARDGAARRHARRADGSDERARPAAGLYPRRLFARRRRSAAAVRPCILRKRRPRFDAGPRGRDAGDAARRGRHVRLRQQPARAGGRPARDDRGVRDPRFRSGLYPPAVLPRLGAVPLGGALRQSQRHRRHRCGGAGDVSRERSSRPLDHEGAREGAVSGPARAHLLARIRRARRDGAEVQLARQTRQGGGPARHRARPPGFGHPWLRPTARPRP